MVGDNSMEKGTAAITADLMMEDDYTEDRDFDIPENAEEQDDIFMPKKLPELDKIEMLAAMSPEERIARLFDNMYPYRNTLLHIVAACRDACAYESLSRQVDDLQRGAWSVYDADNYLQMLGEAGALEKVTAEGEPYGDVAMGPVEVEENGRRFLKVVEPPTVYWRATAAGLRAVEQHDSEREMARLFAEHPDFHRAFSVLLDLCAREGGADIKTLKDAINNRPEMIAANKTAQFLLEYLLNADAVFFDAGVGGWRTNEAGNLARKMLAEEER